MSRQLTFADIPVQDPGTRDEEDDRLAGQNGIIYDYLLQNPGATNVELMNISGSTSGFTARINDIRQWLKKKDQKIKCDYVSRGIYNYWIVKA